MLRSASLLALVTGLVLTSVIARGDDKKEEGYKDLFNGRDLAGLKFELGKGADPAKTYSVKDGVLICTGKPTGYFYTDKSYKNYILKYDWRYVRPEGLEDEEKFLGNSGALLHIQEPHKIFPKCIEAQGMNRDHGKIYAVGGAKVSDTKFDKDALKKVRHKVGEWNTTEIHCKADGAIEVLVNGTRVASGKGELTEGPIGWQSEGAEIHFRNIKIKELK